MKFASSEGFGVPANTAVKAGVAAIGGQELLLRPTEKPTASRLLGQACLAAAGQHNPQRASRLFRHAYLAAQGEAEASANEPKVSQSRLMLAAMTIDLLRMHNQPTTADRLREALHVAVVDQMARFSTLANKGNSRQKDQFIGFASELTAFSLFSRLKHPTMMPVLALAHHDMGEVASQNYDMLLVDATDGPDIPGITKLQIKAGCLRFCGRGDGKSSSKAKRYMEDIVSVSSHCDLGLGGTSVEAQKWTRTLLIAEARDSIRPYEQLMLDDLTNTLLVSVTTPVAERVGAVALY